jgi:hypothetical protein
MVVWIIRTCIFVSDLWNTSKIDLGIEILHCMAFYSLNKRSLIDWRRTLARIELSASLPPLWVQIYRFVVCCSCCWTRCEGSSLAGVQAWMTTTLKSLLWDTISSFLFVLILRFFRSSFGFRSRVTCFAVWTSIVLLWSLKWLREDEVITIQKQL